MPSPDTLFLCPAYKPESALQAQTFIAHCQQLAAHFGLKEQILRDSLSDQGKGDWHRHLHRDNIHKLFEYKYLWPIRGGFGCINWAQDLLLQERSTAPFLIGYSDVSVWHCIWKIKNWGETCYAFMPGTAWGARAQDSLSSCLSGDAWDISQTDFPEVRCLHQGQASGPCFATCLRVLASVTGTAAQPDLNGCILAIEDIDERPYSIERDMTQLHMAGVLDGITGLVVGTMPCTEVIEDYAGPDIEALFRQWGEKLNIPVIQALPFGHDADPLSLPNGRHSTLAVLTRDWSWAFSSR